MNMEILISAGKGSSCRTNLKKKGGGVDCTVDCGERPQPRSTVSLNGNPTHYRT